MWLCQTATIISFCVSFNRLCFHRLFSHKPLYIYIYIDISTHDHDSSESWGIYSLFENQNEEETGMKMKMKKERESDGEKGVIECGEALHYFCALPEACIAYIISLTSPTDACRLSAVSTLFRSAAESDAVWDRFLPTGYQYFLSNSLSCPSKKQVYLSLCDNPVLFDEGRKSFFLGKWSGKKCYMLSARELSIVWGDAPTYWRWISLSESRFQEVAELIRVCWLEIRGKIDVEMLSPSTLYGVYIVFKTTAGAYGFEYQNVEATVGIVGGEANKRSVYLDPERGLWNRNHITPMRVGGPFNRTSFRWQSELPRETSDCCEIPNKREDGWLEIELGEFLCEGGHVGELEMSVVETNGSNWKVGLVVEGIEIRPKRN